MLAHHLQARHSLPRDRQQRLTARLLGVVCAALLATGDAAADVISVSPKGPLTTIQDGIDAAAMGDTVKVKAGLYAENPVIGAELAGLQLIAQGKVTIDARPDSAMGTGPGLQVMADDVLVQGFTFVNAAEDEASEMFAELQSQGAPPPGVGIYATNSGKLTVMRCTFRHNESGGIRSLAANVTLERNVFESGRGPAAMLTGENMKILRNTLRLGSGGFVISSVSSDVLLNRFDDVSGHAVEVTAGDIFLRNNRVNRPGGSAFVFDGSLLFAFRNTITDPCADGITGTGNQIQLNQNRMKNPGGVGTHVNAPNVTVQLNMISATGGAAIISEGALNNVQFNKISDCSGPAITVSAVSFLVAHNVVRNVLCGSAVSVLEATLGDVRDNRITGARLGGIQLAPATSGLKVTDNIITGCILNGADGIFIQGEQHTVSANTIKTVNRDGVRVEGDLNVIMDNLITGAGEDGVDIQSGDDNTVSGNTVKGCAAEGVENNGGGTIVEGNDVTKCRASFANDGTLASFTGNTSDDATAGTPAIPAIDS